MSLEDDSSNYILLNGEPPLTPSAKNKYKMVSQPNSLYIKTSDQKFTLGTLIKTIYDVDPGKEFVFLNESNSEIYSSDELPELYSKKTDLEILNEKVSKLEKKIDDLDKKTETKTETMEAGKRSRKAKKQRKSRKGKSRSRK